MSTRLFAKRVRALDKETSLAMLARAKEMEAAGRKIIHLEIGEPDFETPQNVIQAGMQALQRGYTHYGPSPGLPQARQAIAKHISADRGVDVDADQVVITPGAKAIIFFSVLALVESGDEVIFPSPGFPNYEMTVELLGGKPVAL
ncbi:MAG: aminotransferase class I/II-fold pyridoxal phosphate-dependent enzyme, partial [Candidatus Krumholzibacteria bacterium]|nr:aminotransferase class I/II-fold pyridoxal phosphate-dependent enzyme [Candidatus Krumholzibacteria bacterium]